MPERILPAVENNLWVIGARQRHKSEEQETGKSKKSCEKINVFSEILPSAPDRCERNQKTSP